MKNKNQRLESLIKRATSFFMTVMLVLAIVPCGIFPASAASVKIPSGAKYYNGHMYYVYRGPATWKKAKKLCESRGGHLATITSSGENSFVTNLVKKANIGSCWLGATDEGSEGTWRWVTREKFLYSNWDVNQPDNFSINNERENYLFIWHTYKWNDGINSQEIGYVCEWNVMPTGITQVSSSASSITLSWKDNDFVSKYIIYYYDSSAKKYIKYKTVTKTSITISGLSSATTYKIAIASVINNNGKTLITPKTTFNAVTLPGKTKNLKIEDKISLTWSNVYGADGYVVYHYDSDTKKWEVFDTVKKNSCKIGKKFGNATQQFKVRAYKRSTDGTKFYGSYSNIVKR